MKVLIIHNKYKEHGGEDAVVKNETAILENGGHEVKNFIVSNRNIKDIFDKLAAFKKSKFDHKTYNMLKNELIEFNPDIVHIHNFWPLLGFSGHAAAYDMNIPIIQTLHNYRLICSNAQFLRDDNICEKCLHKSNLWGVYHRCYQNSLSSSFAMMKMQNYAKREGYLNGKIDKFIALTSFSKKKFIKYGIPERNISVKSNVISIKERNYHNDKKEDLLYVGRISKEKGIDIILDVAKELKSIRFKIVGDGPLYNYYRNKAPKNVTFYGKKDSNFVKKIMRESLALIMPSIWYEGFPVTLLEAFSNSLPVIASDIGSLTELIDDDFNGKLFDPGNKNQLIDIIIDTKKIDQNMSKWVIPHI